MQQTFNAETIATLFCKPTRDAIFSSQILFKKHYPNVNETISFRSLHLEKDLPVIHNWVNQPYALEFWQMNGDFNQLHTIYQHMESNPNSHSFIGLLGDQPVCQFDVYSVFADELKDHINAEPHDCGCHLLMAPNVKAVRGLTLTIIRAFLEHYFSFPDAKRLYAEPDVNNARAIALLERSGFRRVKTVALSYKAAQIYCFNKNL